MAKKKGIRVIVTLECTECRERNYTSEKSRRNDPGRIELLKYCARERKHTLHRETK
ncbi:MAG TPA: 50S ribosomal protein L33 [Anaerolineales bacterium]|nr:50S ribosomal protein L33 [Anaerolineales bacterium]